MKMITIYFITYDFCAEENVKRTNDKNIHRVNVSVEYKTRQTKTIRTGLKRRGKYCRFGLNVLCILTFRCRRAKPLLLLYYKCGVRGNGLQRTVRRMGNLEPHGICVRPVSNRFNCE